MIIEKLENGYLVTVNSVTLSFCQKYAFKDFQEMVEFIAHHFNYLKIGEEFERFKVMM
jgi:hypothetical protein